MYRDVPELSGGGSVEANNYDRGAPWRLIIMIAEEAELGNNSVFSVCEIKF